MNVHSPAVLAVAQESPSSMSLLTSAGMCIGSMGRVMQRFAAMIPRANLCWKGFFWPSAQAALSCYDRLVQSKAPFLDAAPFTAPSGKYVNEETLFLPLSDDGKNVNKILAFSYSRDIRRFGDRTGL